MNLWGGTQCAEVRLRSVFFANHARTERKQNVVKTERTLFTREGSQVQSLSRPPVFSGTYAKCAECVLVQQNLTHPRPCVSNRR